MKAVFRRLFFFTFLLIVVSCAKRGRPSGGPIDEEAPLLVTAKPPYETLNFDDKEIELYFNEFVKLKDVTKQLVVSPPLKYPAIVSPQGAASKTIKIEILDTLKQNTTYIFNFGNAVEDNNEANKLEGFKYVFSTGNYIDSLTLKGNVKDPLAVKKLENVNLLLHRIDTAYTDSIIFKNKPSYVSNSLDTSTFKFSNLRKGKFFLYALQESSNDYLYNPRTDKIGFYPDTISLPQDSIILNYIYLFKEVPEYTLKRGVEVSKGKIQFGFEGAPKEVNIKITSDVPKDFKSSFSFEKDKDTINYWFTPFEADSLNFIVSTKKYLDTLTVRLRKNKIDSLQISSNASNTLELRDTLAFLTNNPITKIDTSKISIIDKDTLTVNFKTKLSKSKKELQLIFDKKPKDKYQVSLLPKAIEDIYDIPNDSINLNLSTKDLEDYGRITLDVINSKSKNVIIELLDRNLNVIEKQFINKSTSVIFDLLSPKEYKVRAIIDENNNKKWDTGNLLKRILPEEIIPFPESIKVRANYYITNTFTVN